jgi:hypothetical protein
MEYVIAGLAVYKTLQVIDVLLPKEAMPWVKILAGVVFGYGASFIAGVEDKVLGGLVVATVAGAAHGLLRLVTLLGDMAQKKTYR